MDLSKSQPPIAKWNFFVILSGIVLGIALSGCSDSDPTQPKESQSPQMEIMKIPHIAEDSATVQARVTDDGGAAVTERGICWSTSGSPTIEDSVSRKVLKTQGGTYWIQLSGLQEGSTYYVRAYGTNEAGKTGYSHTLRFKTKKPSQPPQVQIMNMTHIAEASAMTKAKVTDDGGSTLTERGICWSTSEMPTIGNSDSQTTLRKQGVTYWSKLSGLKKGTTYYARAYATNRAGKTGYSDTLRFKARINWNRAANKSIQSLISNFWNPQGYFNTNNKSNHTFGYWPQAHAMDVLVKAYSRTDKEEYGQYIQDLYNGVHRKTGNFINDYYDDMEWNTLAMLRAYKATGEQKFKTTVRGTLWPEIKGGWTDDVTGGGIMWAKFTPKSKNAVSNGPASIIGAKLYQMDHNKEDLDWAKKTFQWEKNHLVDPTTGVVWDHITPADGITKWTFVYNEGTYLGAALKLYHITSKQQYLTQAVRAADYTLDHLTTDGLLNKGQGDGALFKAVFVRYFTQLIMEKDLPESTRSRYVTFLEANARTLWNDGTNPFNSTFGTFWADKPGSKTGLNADLSGLALMEAAAQLQAKGYFEE